MNDEIPIKDLFIKAPKVYIPLSSGLKNLGVE